MQRVVAGSGYFGTGNTIRVVAKMLPRLRCHDTKITLISILGGVPRAWMTYPTDNNHLQSPTNWADFPGVPLVLWTRYEVRYLIKRVLFACQMTRRILCISNEPEQITRFIVG